MQPPQPPAAGGITSLSKKLSRKSFCSDISHHSSKQAAASPKKMKKVSSIPSNLSKIGSTSQHRMQKANSFAMGDKTSIEIIYTGDVQESEDDVIKSKRSSSLDSDIKMAICNTELAMDKFPPRKYS